MSDLITNYVSVLETVHSAKVSLRELLKSHPFLPKHLDDIQSVLKSVQSITHKVSLPIMTGQVALNIDYASTNELEVKTAVEAIELFNAFLAIKKMVPVSLGMRSHDPVSSSHDPVSSSHDPVSSSQVCVPLTR